MNSNHCQSSLGETALTRPRRKTCSAEIPVSSHPANIPGNLSHLSSRGSGFEKGQEKLAGIEGGGSLPDARRFTHHLTASAARLLEERSPVKSTKVLC